MIKKTGREIHKLRKAKLGPGELDKHMFQEKMTFLTTSMCQVPPLLLNEDILTSVASNSSRSSTLKHASSLVPVDSLCSFPASTSGLEAGISCPHGDLNPDPETEDSSSSSTCSTPTPHLKPTVLLGNGSPVASEFVTFAASPETETDSNSASATSTASERFSYEIDPDIGVIVWN